MSMALRETSPHRCDSQVSRRSLLALWLFAALLPSCTWEDLEALGGFLYTIWILLLVSWFAHYVLWIIHGASVVSSMLVVALGAWTPRGRRWGGTFAALSILGGVAFLFDLDPARNPEQLGLPPRVPWAVFSMVLGVWALIIAIRGRKRVWKS
jgi:hypothetical protein